MDREIEEIKSRLTIDELVSEYVKLKKAGSGLVGLCPFHSEKTPSFHISPDRGIYKCFGCGESGDIFSFLQKFEGLTFPEVKKKLADRTGVILSNFNENNSIQPNFQKQEKEKGLFLLDKATTFWQKNLALNEEAKNYLKKRGVSGEIAKKFRLGLALDQWNSLEKYLQGLDFSVEEMLKVGLIKKNEQGKIYDRFRNRIIFPIFDEQDNPVAFSGRDLSNSDKVAKYLNSPESIFFDKSDILFGFNWAKVEARKRGYFILVEGQMDLIMNHQIGFTNTVATSGTSLTEKHLKKLARFSKNLIFAFDSDRAGLEAAFKGIKKALALDFDVKILDIPTGKDPADIILESAEKWKKIVQNSKNIIEFFINKISLSDLDLKQKNQAMMEKIYPFVISINSPIEQNYYLGKISEAFGVEKKAVREELELAKKQFILAEEQEQKRGKVLEKKLDIFSENTIIEKTQKKILKQLTAIYYWQKNLKNSEPLVDHKKVLEIIKKYTSEKTLQDILNLEDNHSEYLSSLIFEIEILYAEKETHALEYDLQEMTERLEREKIKNEISILKKELYLANENERKEILQKIQKLNQKKHGG